MKTKVAVTMSSFAKYDYAPFDLLSKKGIEIIENKFRRKLKKTETVELCADCIGIIAGIEEYDSEVLERLPLLKVISRCGTGMDSINLERAKDLGIKVFNTPDGPTLAVAELTIGLILNLLRKVNQADSFLKVGKWDKFMGNLLSGKKVGIIGYGKIGQKVGQLLANFNVELSYYDIKPKQCVLNCSPKPLDEIFKWADIITLHLSRSFESNNVIGAKELALMKEGSFIINLSRGGILDEEALYDALKSNKLAGAAIDVFKEEPYQGPLTELENIILTPHIGSYAKEARIQMEIQAVENLLKGIELVRNINIKD